MSLDPEQTAAAERLQNFYDGDAPYNPTTNPGGMRQGGHRINFAPALRDVATVGVASAEQAELAETAAEQAQGYAAAARGAGIFFVFDTATADADPGGGKFRLNNAALASATALFIDLSTAAGADVTAWIATWDDSDSTVRGELTFIHATDATIWAKFQITGANTNPAGYRKVAVAYVAHAGAFANGAEFAIAFSRTGSKGIPGDEGDAGPAPTLTIGTVSTGAPGTDVDFDMVPTGLGAYQVNVTIPRGNPGEDGEGAGNVNPTGAITSGRLARFADGTGNLIEDSGKTIADFATAAQGALADSAVQPGDLGTAAVAALDTDTALAANSDARVATQKAVKAHVAAAIAALLNSAPGALDTLDELAAALGDDPNFATTVTNALATKLAKNSNLSDLQNAGTARTNLGLSANGSSLVTAANYAAMKALLAVVAADIGDASANGRSLITAANYAAMKTLLSIAAADISNASANGRSLITAADYAAMRTLLNVGNGADQTNATSVGNALNLMNTVEFGGGLAGDRIQFWDWHASAGTDYDARFIRYAGVNGQFGIENVGTGGISVNAGSGALTLVGTGFSFNGNTFTMLNVEDQAISGGARVTVKDLGTITSGTLTVDPGDRPMQKCVRNGAFTLAPGTNKGAYYLSMVNGASASTLTTSGWGKVVGDALTNTNAHKFLLIGVIDDDGSVLNIIARQ